MSSAKFNVVMTHDLNVNTIIVITVVPGISPWARNIQLWHPALYHMHVARACQTHLYCSYSDCSRVCLLLALSHVHVRFNSTAPAWMWAGLFNWQQHAACIAYKQAITYISHTEWPSSGTMRIVISACIASGGLHVQGGGLAVGLREQIMWRIEDYKDK